MSKQPPGKAPIYERLAHLAKAMANGKRLELLELVSQGEQSVDALARLSGSAVTTTSAQLQVLRRVGLVSTRRQGTTIFYSLAGDDVAALMVQMKAVGLKHSAEVRDAWRSQQGDGAKVVSLHSLQSAGGTVFMLDVRPSAEFTSGHFPGAVSIPLTELPGRTDEVPTDRPVVVYCRGEFCTLAREAAVLLSRLGVDAAAMDEGVLEWRADESMVLHASA
ncbi:metalloregulator ArsR/SmtB family transcription factor [soil metagenome]